MRYLSLILTILLIFFAVDIGAEEWSRLNTEHFATYHISNEAKACEVGKISEDFYIEITDRFNFIPDKKIEIWICNSKKQFRTNVNGAIQDWAIGCAYPLIGRIVIQNPTFIEKQHFELSKIVKHEIVHVILGLYLGKNVRNIPLWFNEGLTMYLSEGWSISRHWIILGNVITQSIIPLSELSETFPQNNSLAQLAYAESHSAISMMFGEYGEAKINNIINQIGKGENFPKAFFNVTGIELNEFEKKWMDFLNTRYKWVSILSSSLVVWVLISIVFIYVYWQYRKTMHNKMEKWEQKENQKDEFFDLLES